VPTLQLRYEEVCAEPTGAALSIAAFLDRPEPTGLTPPVIDLARANAVSPDERGEHVWAICARTAERLGYQRAL
jgi:hypothetical protein